MASLFVLSEQASNMSTFNYSYTLKDMGFVSPKIVFQSETLYWQKVTPGHVHPLETIATVESNIQPLQLRVDTLEDKFELFQNFMDLKEESNKHYLTHQEFHDAMVHQLKQLSDAKEMQSANSDTTELLFKKHAKFEETVQLFAEQVDSFFTRLLKMEHAMKVQDVRMEWVEERLHSVERDLNEATDLLFKLAKENCFDQHTQLLNRLSRGFILSDMATDKVKLTLPNGQHLVFQFKKGQHMELVKLFAQIHKGEKKPMLLELKTFIDAGSGADGVKEAFLRFYWNRMCAVEKQGKEEREAASTLSQEEIKTP